MFLKRKKTAVPKSFMTASTRKTYSRHMISTRKNMSDKQKKTRLITKDISKRPRNQDLTSTSSNIDPARNFQKKSTHIASDTDINGTMPTASN